MTWNQPITILQMKRRSDNVIVCGGKTGTTDDAVPALQFFAKDRYGNPYISIIPHSESKDTLYLEMNQPFLIEISDSQNLNN